jgi:hypothetical protein
MFSRRGRVGIYITYCACSNPSGVLVFAGSTSCARRTTSDTFVCAYPTRCARGTVSTRIPGKTTTPRERRTTHIREGVIWAHNTCCSSFGRVGIHITWCTCCTCFARSIPSGVLVFAGSTSYTYCIDRSTPSGPGCTQGVFWIRVGIVICY